MFLQQSKLSYPPRLPPNTQRAHTVPAAQGTLPHLAHFLTEIFPHLLFKIQGLQQCLVHKQMFSKCLLNPHVLGK